MNTSFQETLLRLRTLLTPPGAGTVPRRVRETFDRYDRIRGFGAYLEKCQRALRRDVPEETHPLHEQHIELIRFMPEEKALAYKERAYAESRGMIYKRGYDNRGILDIEDGALFDDILADIFSPEVDARIVRFFGSEYVPWWYCFQESQPGAKEGRAFYWHCDKGPSKWLKVLLYFTPSSETGGNTLVLDKADSDAVAAADYTFGPVKKRTGSLQELSRLAGRELKALQFDIKPGEGVLFEPATLLHKGQLPDKAPRFIMQLLILPSPVPWREGLERLRQSDLSERHELAFPAHARQLEEVLMPRH